MLHAEQPAKCQYACCGRQHAARVRTTLLCMINTLQTLQRSDFSQPCQAQLPCSASGHAHIRPGLRASQSVQGLFGWDSFRMMPVQALILNCKVMSDFYTRAQAAFWYQQSGMKYDRSELLAGAACHLGLAIPPTLALDAPSPHMYRIGVHIQCTMHSQSHLPCFLCKINRQLSLIPLWPRSRCVVATLCTQA